MRDRLAELLHLQTPKWLPWCAYHPFPPFRTLLALYAAGLSSSTSFWSDHNRSNHSCQSHFPDKTEKKFCGKKEDATSFMTHRKCFFSPVFAWHILQRSALHLEVHPDILSFLERLPSGHDSLLFLQWISLCCLCSKIPAEPVSENLW